MKNDKLIEIDGYFYKKLKVKIVPEFIWEDNKMKLSPHINFHLLDSYLELEENDVFINVINKVRVGNFNTVNKNDIKIIRDFSKDAVAKIVVSTDDSISDWLRKNNRFKGIFPRYFIEKYSLLYSEKINNLKNQKASDLTFHVIVEHSKNGDVIVNYDKMLEINIQEVDEDDTLLILKAFNAKFGKLAFSSFEVVDWLRQNSNVFKNLK